MAVENWRLLPASANRGSENMAVDEAVFRSVEQGHSPPTLRFYQWAPPCVSLGRLQNARAIAAARLKRLGVDLVRRPTGGRAILHEEELTYSAVAPLAACPMGRDVMAVYRWISSGLVAGLKRLGVAATLAPRRQEERAHRLRSPSCFSSAARCDLVVDNRKLVGSAQARGRHAFLQHGAIPLVLDRRLWVELLGPRGDPGEAATDLYTFLGPTPVPRLVEALVSGFEAVLQIRLTPGTLTPAERRLATRLATEKYNRLW